MKRELSFKQVHLSSGLFVFPIRVHWWFVFISIVPFFHECIRTLPAGTACAWERGRPARMLSLWLPLSFSAMPQAATLSSGTAAARPKESHGAVPV